MNKIKDAKKKVMVKNDKNHKQKSLFIITAILMTIYLLWRLLFTLPLKQSLPQMIFAILLWIAETVTVMTTFELYYRKSKADDGHLDMPVIPEYEYPDIDVFIATHNEPCDVLYKTASACTYMDYPDKSKVHIYLCDDTCRQEVFDLANELKIGYLSIEDNKYAKSGNLNNALAKTSSPLIATFDADMIPRRSFLMDTVPYFALPYYINDNGVWRLRNEDEIDENLRVGLIQTPQSFYNLDLFQFNLFAEDKIPNEQDFFSIEVNQMRNSSNACAYTGSNTVILRKAMNDIGGFPYHTITEDFETSCRLQMEGYLTYATDKIEAHGLSTTDVRSMMKQRVRWARGVIQSIQNTHAVFSSKLSFSARVTYLNAFLYWWSFFNRIIFILAPIMFALFDFQVVDCNLIQLLIFWLPSYFFYSLSMKQLSNNVRSQKWSQIIDTTLAPSLIIPVFLETLHIRETKFKVTNKKKQKENSRALLYMLPHLVLIVLSVLAIIRFVKGKYGMALVYSAVIIYWLCYNLIALLYAVGFMLGREMPRKSERIEAINEATLVLNDDEIRCETVNLSDNGVLIKSDRELPKDIKDVKLIIENELYKANLKADFVYSNKKKEDDKTVYYSSFIVEPISGNDKKEYIQLIYDRDTGITKEIDGWNTTFDDLLRIFKKRTNNLINDIKKKDKSNAKIA